MNPEAPQPTSATLSAKIIRKCPTHSDCPLTCKQRRVEDLGEIARFSTPEAGWVSRMYHKFFDKESS